MALTKLLVLACDVQTLLTGKRLQVIIEIFMNLQMDLKFIRVLFVVSKPHK